MSFLCCRKFIKGVIFVLGLIIMMGVLGVFGSLKWRFLRWNIGIFGLFFINNWDRLILNFLLLLIKIFFRFFVVEVNYLV